jgi:hypothetical protein
MTGSSTSRACTQCGAQHQRRNRWGEIEELCLQCESKRLTEIQAIYDHFTKNPDDCCCNTYLGRHCCMSPKHGGYWRVNAISDGNRFHSFIRAWNKQEAIEVGNDMCQSNGEECISVSKVKADSKMRDA